MIYEKLARLQEKLKVPKSRNNSFGNYKYRSLEDILDAVKKPLLESKLNLYLNDEIVNIGVYNYVKATATLYDFESKESLTVSAYAREAESKKGMDDSQITGSTSSYARKYCLNALFLIDDTKDADTDEYTTERKARALKEEKLATDKQKDELSKLCETLKLDKVEILNAAGWKKGDPFTEDTYAKALVVIKERQE